jgi:inosose dehydratase
LGVGSQKAMTHEFISIFTKHSRRAFLSAAGVAAVAGSVGNVMGAAYQGLDKIKFGYAAMTWGKEERQAADDIASAGYKGVQFRIDATTEFRPSELKELLREKKLTFVALSSGEVLIDPAVEAEQIRKHVANAQFVRDSGGLYLQVLDQLKPYPRKVTAEECVRLGKLLTEIGRRTAELGVPLAYHNHMNTISEHPGNLEIVLENADPKYVKLLLDTAHSAAGGGDPAQAIERYHDRIIFLHLKDEVSIPMTEKEKYPFRWVELGQGQVNLPAVFAALAKIHFSGWAVVELDRVPDNSKTPKQCAMISRKYLEDKIGVVF